MKPPRPNLRLDKLAELQPEILAPELTQLDRAYKIGWGLIWCLIIGALVLAFVAR